MKTKAKKQIVQCGLDASTAHRADFETCPECECRMDHQKWNQCAVQLCLQPRISKSSSVSVVSECPKCFEKSWVHERMDGFGWNDAFPQSWKDAVEKLHDATRLQAARDWGAGLCWQCKHLTEAKIDHSTYRTCKKGMGPAATECDIFERIKTP